MMEENIFEKNLKDPLEKQSIVSEIDNFGVKAINKSQSKNNLLSTRFVDFERGGDNVEQVGNSLQELNLQIKDLDPSVIDFAKTGFLGRFFNPARKYFNKYEKSDALIANILKSLDIGQRSLQNDNFTLANEEKQLLLITEKLQEDIELGLELDKKIEEQIQKAELDDSIEDEKILFVKEEVLFPLRQRLQDMQQVIVVNQQGIMSLNIIQKNNKELIRGVDRAKNVTVTALRTGVMVASALLNQKLVIDKINALNQTTNDIIDSTSKMLREQGTEIHRQSVETCVNPEVLKNAFMEAMQAMEEISKYKVENLPKLQENIQAFQELAKDGQKVIDKITENAEGKKLITE